MIEVELLRKIDFKKFQEPDYFFLKAQNDRELLKIRDKWLGHLLRFDCVLPPVEKVDFLFLRSLVRDDYSSLVQSIVEQIDSSYRVAVVSDYNAPRDSINLEISSMFSNCSSLIQFMTGERQLEQQCLYIRFIHYLYIIRKLFSYEPKVLVAFADMQPIENLAVQLFKMNGVKTVTLQHGLYIDYGDMDTVNIVNYKNHVADYFLAWGENTNRLIKKYHQKSHTIDCGKPKIFGLPAVSELPETRRKARDILVVTDQKIFDEQNFAMLDAVFSLSDQIGCKVYVRFHPSNDKQLYKARFPELIELKFVKQNFLVIGHTTSMIYEAFTVGYPAIRYASEIPSLSWNSKNEFLSKDELLKKVRSVASFEQYSSGLLEEQSEFIKATGRRSLELYRQALIKIIEG